MIVSSLTYILFELFQNINLFCLFSSLLGSHGCSLKLYQSEMSLCWVREHGKAPISVPSATKGWGDMWAQDTLEIEWRLEVQFPNTLLHALPTISHGFPKQLTFLTWNVIRKKNNKVPCWTNALWSCLMAILPIVELLTQCDNTGSCSCCLGFGSLLTCRW